MMKIKVLSAKKLPTKLCVFDFDGTLFKSPEKLKGYDGNWWASKESLDYPNVPKNPGSNFWNDDIVNTALKEISNKNNYCILLTGRLKEVFDDRVKQLLSQKNLNFNYIMLNTFGNDTGTFKIKEIKQILNKHPTIKNIEIWDDESDKIKLYTNEFAKSYNFKINKV